MNGSTTRAEGERRRDAALALLEARRAVYIRRGQLALLTALLALGTATADEVRDAVELPPGIGPKCFGAVPLALARLGIIRADGFTKTCRPMAHARPVTLWVLADQAAAERWLLAHPDMPDPAEAPAAQRQCCLFDQETATPTVPAAGAAL